MSAEFLQCIDWQRPWLKTLVPMATSILAAEDWRQELNRLVVLQKLHNHRDLPLRFVPQQSLPHGVAYESFISATGAVPTRENLHDFFNALVWLAFPRIKSALNKLQSNEIKRVPVQMPQRGRLRDAATLFDENSALFVTSEAMLADALRSHHWQDAFVRQRTCFTEARCDVTLFGHALMEKLVAPYKAITAHAWIVMVEASFFDLPVDIRLAFLDELVAEKLANGLTTADFTPLPVLGVPGWWAGQDADFYADAEVFRARRTKLVRVQP